MHSRAYLKGVLDGDGYLDRERNRTRICLVTKSKFFIKNFQGNLEKQGITSIRIKEMKIPDSVIWGRTIKTNNIFYRIRKYISKEKLSKLLNFNPSTQEEKVSYLRGFYQSEGCYCNYKGKYYYINFTNKNKRLLDKVASFLADLGIRISGMYHRVCEKEHWANWQLYIYRQSEVEKFKQIIGEQK